MTKRENEMFLNASPEIFSRAKQLRGSQTVQEMKLWEYLRKSPLNVKFRRQHPIKVFIADFYCHALKLIIEVDGGIHKDKAVAENDIERQRNLESEGMTFIRFNNSEVDNNFDAVIEKIEKHLSDNALAIVRKRQQKLNP